MRYEINLAERPFVNYLPHLILLGFLGAVAVGLTAWNASLFLGTRAAASHVESRLAQTAAYRRQLESRQEQLRTELARAELSVLRENVSVANDVLSQKAVSWALLLERLEEVLPWSAQLSSIRTTVRDGDVQMKLELLSRNPEYHLEFIDLLEMSPCFSDVYPTSEEEEFTGDFKVSLNASHDPHCGQGPDEPSERRGRRERRRG